MSEGGCSGGGRRLRRVAIEQIMFVIGCPLREPATTDAASARGCRRLTRKRAAVPIDLNAAEGSLDHLEAKAADAGATWEIRSGDF
jgi:hypothetical protein